MVDTVSVKRCAEGSGSGRMATLQARKQALQEKLAARNEELRRLCIQEAELTGTMPPEVPLEPGEDPPPFRRVVGTAYAYPQNLINKLKTSEIESIAALELEKQVQVGISEAALGLVHNGSASKAARRKNRLVYQQSQKRLSELDERLGYLMAARTDQQSKETKLNQQIPHHQIQTQSYPQFSQTKYKKKPRPATIDVDKSDHRLHHIPSTISYDDNHSGHYSTHSGGEHGSVAGALSTNSLRGLHDRLERTTSVVHPRQQIQLAPHQQYDHVGLGGYWMCLDNGETVWCSVEPNYWQRETRFGSLDRSKPRMLQHKWSAPTTFENDDMHRHLAHTNSNHIKTMPDLSKHHRLQQQTHSLSNVASHMTVDSSNISPSYRERTGSRKYKQKKWYETSLDQPIETSSTHHSGSLESMLPPHSPYHHSPLTTPTKQSHNNTSQPTIGGGSTPSPHPPPTPPARIPPIDLPILSNLDTNNTSPFPNTNTVQVQSPKNCTVIQAGQWKPYREVTKPFEMSDFYKYSTKFRNRNNNNISNNNLEEKSTSENQSISMNNILSHPNDSSPHVMIDNGGDIDVTDSVGQVYHKGIYQPLQPMKCQPFNYSTNNSAIILTDNLVGIENQTKQMYLNNSPTVAVEIASHQHVPAPYGQSNHNHSFNSNNNAIKTNTMPTSTLV